MTRIFHGGDLITAEKEFGIKEKGWLDLSTGINPNSWPVPTIPKEIWQRLPNSSDCLIETAKSYYKCNELIPTPGSQSSIQVLPTLFSNKQTVAIPKIGYAEHYEAWKTSGYEVISYTDDALEKLDQLIHDKKINILIVINPNNPTCKLIPKKKLLSWLHLLKNNHGYLIIDEAFIDVTPEESMANELDNDNLIIFRSIGKFFGLAGIRLGFLLANKTICNEINDKLGPWAVSNPARWIGSKALADYNWQHQTRENLIIKSRQLSQYVMDVLSLNEEQACSTPLFVSVILDKTRAKLIYIKLAQKGVLIRKIDSDRNSYLRFGLVKQENWLQFTSKFESII